LYSIQKCTTAEGSEQGGTEGIDRRKRKGVKKGERKIRE
jgi:hypothetical protein